MKKVIIIGGLVGLGFLLFKPKQNQNQTTTNTTTTGAPPKQTFWEKYNGRILADVEGYWMLVLNGKCYTFRDVAHISEYTLQYPQYSEVLKVDFPAWREYAVQNYAGEYNSFVK